MSFSIRRDQLFALRRSQFVAQLRRALTGSRVQTSSDPNSGDLLLTDCAGRVTRVTVGTYGLPFSTTSPEGRTYRSKIGDDGRLRELINPAGFHVGLEYDSGGRLARLSAASQEVWRLRYDNRGRLAQINYSDSTTTRFHHGGAGGPLAVTDRLGITETFRFDGNRLVSLLDGNGNETRFEYGIWDRPVRAIHADGSLEAYAYDQNGAVAGILWGASAQVQIQNDAERKPLQFRYGDGQIVRFAYDNAGNVVEATCGEQKASFCWDEARRLVAEGDESSAVRYERDAAGNVAAVTYPGGERVRFEYDQDDRVVSIVDWSGESYKYRYLSEDRGRVQTAPGGLITTVGYSPVGVPTIVTVKTETSRRLFATSFVYDEKVRLTESEDSEFGPTRYAYDAEGQLLSCIQGHDASRSEEFAYDASGNRILENGRLASFDVVNRQLDQGGIALEYDDRGNSLKLAARGGQWRFVWDQRNLLIAASGPAGEQLTFGYDAFGRRVWKRVSARSGKPETTIRYVWAGEQLITQFTRAGGSLRRQDFLYVPGTYFPVATRVGMDVYTYHCDHRGAPTRLTDRLGNVVWSATYSAFGMATIHCCKIDNPLRLPGQWEDSETGLYYNRFRYYSPLLGRYLSRDPLGLVAGCNLYTYVGNDPVNRIDPMGLWKGSDVAIAVVAGLLAVVAVVAIAVTAPIAVPALVTGAGAAAMGVGVGFGVYKANTLKDPNPETIGKAFLSGFVDGARFIVGLLAATALLPEAATVFAVGAAGYGIYGMCSEHFGWEEGSVPFSEMSAEKQNESVGGLWGGLFGALAVGGLAAKYFGEPTNMGKSLPTESLKSVVRPSSPIEGSPLTPSGKTPPVTSKPSRMGPVTAGPEGVVEHGRSSPVVERSPPGRLGPSARPDVSASPRAEPAGPVAEPTASRGSNSSDIAEVYGEETSTTPETERAEFVARADGVREQMNPRTSKSTTGPERARAANEAEGRGPRPDDMRGNEAEIGSTVPEERPSDLFDDPNAPTQRSGEPLKRACLREDTKADIEANAETNENGEFVDSEGNVIEDPDYGHIYGYENHRIIKAGEELGLNQGQLNEYVNSRPEYFQIEEHSKNISHEGEMPGTDGYDGILEDMKSFFGL